MRECTALTGFARRRYDPEQVAATIQEFIDLGCTEFCFSGYPHDEEAERFGRLVMPYFADRIEPQAVATTAR